MVVQNRCTSLDACLIASANRRLTGVAAFNNVDIDIRDVQVRLMNAHAAAAATDNLGVPGLLNSTQITVYHYTVFNDLGLPNRTVIMKDA